MATRAKKKILAKRFARAIRVHYRDLEHAYVYWIWLRGTASYVIILYLARAKAYISLFFLKSLRDNSNDPVTRSVEVFHFYFTKKSIVQVFFK